MADEGWFSFTRRVIRLFTEGEVKTPLSFMFKALLALVAGTGLILWSPIPHELKGLLIGLYFLVLVLFCAGILLFAWFKPRNLVYGEAGHRADRKLEYGTERHTLTLADMQRLPQSKNVRQLGAGDQRELNE